MDPTDTCKLIKNIFKKCDSEERGVITCEEVAQIFRELDDTWDDVDIDRIFKAVDTEDMGHVSYNDFINFIMEVTEDEDDTNEGVASDDLNHDVELEGVELDFNMPINKEEWLLMMHKFDFDEDEAEEIYQNISEEAIDNGEDISKGVRLYLLLEELKIENDDREGMKEIANILLEVHTQFVEGTARNVEKPAEAPALRTALDKIVRRLDCLRKAASDVWSVVEEDNLPFSKSELKAVQSFKDKKTELCKRVQQYMISPPLVCALAGQVACVERCVAEVNQIVAKCRAEGTKYVDLDFDLANCSPSCFYVDKEKPGYDCTVGKPYVCKRLTDLINAKTCPASTASKKPLVRKGAGHTTIEGPVLFKGGICPGDIIQGQVGTCFLLGAIGAVVSNKPDVMKKIFIRHDVDVGVYGVQFNVDGEWTSVIVDDYVPVDAFDRVLYAKSRDHQEVWSILLEKAFCKLHTCYEMCDGGQASEAIFSLFGGVSGKFVIKQVHRDNPQKYFMLLKQARDRGWLLTTTFVRQKGKPSKAQGKCGEDVLPSGLVFGHAYSVLKVLEAGGNQLIQLRNPWGQGEWLGKWSDKNTEGEWTEEMKAAAGYIVAEDGKFWMSVEDFVMNTSGAEYSRTFGPNWKKVTHHKHFQKGDMTAKALWSFKARQDGELSMTKGDDIVVLSMNPGWWHGHIKDHDDKKAFFPANYVKLNSRPVARFDMVGTCHTDGPLTIVAMLLQPNSCMQRMFYKRKQDGLNYKDTSYPSLQLCIVGSDGKTVLKKEGRKRSVWGEMKFPRGGEWKLYALSVDGRGGDFTLRVYVKGGSVTITEVPGATLDEVTTTLQK